MKLPKAKNFKAEKYIAGLSLFKQKFAKIKTVKNGLHSIIKEKNMVYIVHLISKKG